MGFTNSVRKEFYITSWTDIQQNPDFTCPYYAVTAILRSFCTFLAKCL